MTYTIDAYAGEGGGGTISPSGRISVEQGGTVAFLITPDSECQVKTFIVDGIPDPEYVGNTTPFTYVFSNVQSDHTINPNFEARKYMVIIAHTPEEGGTTVPANDFVEVVHGGSLTITFHPTEWYTIEKYNVNGVDYPAADSVTLTNITSTSNVTVYFAAKPKYKINASTEGFGTINPGGEVWVHPGDDQLFIFSAFPGYRVGDVVIDGVHQGAIDSYTFQHVDRDHVIKVIFDTYYKKLSFLSGSDKILRRNNKLIRFKNQWGK